MSLSPNKTEKQILKHHLFTASSANFNSTLYYYIRNSRFNTSSTPKPSIIVTPLQESQVPTIIKCARKTATYLRIRGGGHDYEALSYTSKTPFAILDMFNLRSIKVNMSTKTAWVQSGAQLGELYNNIWKNSKVHAFPSGVCSTVGIGGHFSGGGYGNMLRKFGLTIDNLIDARLVDAKGRILDRKSMGEDLFWAIRGGGAASFGVILAFKIQLVRVPPVVTVFQVRKALEENATDIAYHWQYIADKTDRNLFLRVFFQPFTAENTGQKTVTASFIALYLGRSKGLVSLLKKELPELGVTDEDCKELSWIRSVLFWAGFPEESPECVLLSRKPATLNAFKMKSDYVKTPISRDGLRGILNKMVGRNILMQFNPYSGKMSEIPESAAAFPHRAGNIYKIQCNQVWNETEPAQDKKYIDDLREFYDYMTPFVSQNPREAFLNYRDIDIGSTNNGANAYAEGKVYGVKYFKGNFDRLVKVKTKVDPENFFRSEQSIPPLVNSTVDSVIDAKLVDF